MQDPNIYIYIYKLETTRALSRAIRFALLTVECVICIELNQSGNARGVRRGPWTCKSPGSCSGAQGALPSHPSAPPAALYP